MWRSILNAVTARRAAPLAPPESTPEPAPEPAPEPEPESAPPEPPELGVALGPDPYAEWRAVHERDPASPAATSSIEIAAHPSQLTGTAPFVLLTDPGCTLSARAVAAFAAAIAAEPALDLAYGDEDRIDADGRRHDPFFKPGWSTDLALEQDLAGGACLFRRSLLAGLGERGAWAHDLALLAAPGRVRHVPAIVCHRAGPRRPGPDPAVVAEVLVRWPDGPVGPSLVPSRFGGGRVQWRIRPPAPRVSVIVPTRDQPDLLRRCMDGLLERTDYPDLEVIIADNGTQEPEALALLAELGRDPRVRVLPSPGGFNYSAINNAAAAAASGEVLALLNNDVEVIEPGWLREMAGHALRPDVGAVGARLLFADGRIQHAGVVLGVGRFEDGPGIAGHFGLAAAADDAGHGGQFVTTREVSAVTGACLVLRRSVFAGVGGLDAANLPVSLNDIDLCLRIRAQGLRIVWTPFAELYHLESASRGSDQLPHAAARFRRECRYMRDRWGGALDGDRFYNPNFSRYDHSFQLSLLTESTPLSRTA